MDINSGPPLTAGGIHPLIRVICFLILSLFLSLGSGSHTAAIFVVMVPFWFATGWRPLVAAMPLLRRMRWFFLSILIIYWWLTPGEALWRGAPDWLPTADGVVEGLHRVVILVLLICALRLVFWDVARDALVAAIYRLLWPLSSIGLSRERVAVRLILVFETVDSVQGVVRDAVAAARSAHSPRLGVVDAAALAMSQVMSRAECAVCQEVDIDIGTQPPYWQWCMPLVLGIALWGVGYV